MTAPGDRAGPTERPGAQELDVDLSAFLPDGVTVGCADPDQPLGGLGDAEAEPAAFDPAVLARLDADLAAVDEALVAIDEGRYHGGPWDRLGP